MKHRRLSAPEKKKLTDDARLLRAWKSWHCEEREAALAGPHGSALTELFRILTNLRHVQPSQLIGFVRSVDWTTVERGARLAVLHELNTAIIEFREKRGLPVFDDDLSDQPTTPFQIVQAIVLVRAPAGAQPGSKNCQRV
jgi:hypothetical protein